jgi:hypothetical protein
MHDNPTALRSWTISSPALATWQLAVGWVRSGSGFLIVHGSWYLQLGLRVHVYMYMYILRSTTGDALPGE